MELRLARLAAPASAAVRFLLAATVIFAVAYVLSWQLLWGGMAGSEAPFHLHLITWVASTFPNLPWWYPWDAMGVSYREAYPLAAHWLAVAASRLLGTDLEGGAQAVQFSLMPLTALGLYGYFDWRLRRPIAGLAAALLLLLSPIGWVEFTHFGLYASWVGMVFFMPALIALDVFFHRWLAREGGWRTRLAAVAYVGLTTVMGVVSPHLLAAPLIAAAAFAIAIPRASAHRAWRWTLVVLPSLFLGVAILSAFWLGAELQYLAVVRSHWAGPGTSFDVGRFPPIALNSVLSLQPLRSGNLGDLYSVSPAVLLPALLAVPLAWRDGRSRLLLGLVLLGIVFMTDPDVYRPLFLVPGFKEFAIVAHRPWQLLVTVAAPSLAALGLFELPPFVASFAFRRWSGPGWMHASGAAALTVGIIVVLGADVWAFSDRVEGGGQLAYGPSLPNAADLRDLWKNHETDVCLEQVQGFAQLCGDQALSATFSVLELTSACRVAGRTRTDPPVCRGLQLDDPTSFKWNGDLRLIDQTQSWCLGRVDPVCDARYTPLAQQLLDPTQWRAPNITCSLECPAERSTLETFGAVFPSPPVRAELNSNIGPLDMAFHDLVGGGITHSYNDQVIPSRELSSWIEDNMLQTPGTTVKAQLAQATGIDAVVLSPQQASRAADYTAMGWSQVSSNPVAFVNPQPAGLAAEWPGGNAVLVIGQTQNSVPELYNFVFKRATSGALPFAVGWLVRGNSPYVDDYSEQDLSHYAGVIVLGYQYHDREAAWSRLDGFVRAGGSLYAETGWQFVDPDWNGGSAPQPLPVPSLQWGLLNPTATVTVEGAADPAFGPMVFQGAGWGASAAAALRPGAEELVRVGDRIVAARWQVGRGREVWSGMNLIAHDAASNSADEDRFVASQFAWLLPSDGTQETIEPHWNGDNNVALPLSPSDRPTLVLFKESLFPGWSAQLEWPGGSRPVPLVGSEMDFMLAMLDGVPQNATLVFSYGPTRFEDSTWALSAAAAVVLIVWAVIPAVLRRGRSWLAQRSQSLRVVLASRVASRVRFGDEDD